jgi:hypothetical protein
MSIDDLDRHLRNEHGVPSGMPADWVDHLTDEGKVIQHRWIHDQGIAPAHAHHAGPMQEGGIVEGPTEAVVGEAGPEAVTPIEPDKAEAMAERMAEAAEEAAEETETAAEDTEDARVRRVLQALADFAEAEAEEATEAAEEATEAAEEGETAEAAAAATEAAAHAEAAISAEEAAEEIAPRRRGFARLMWGE